MYVADAILSKKKSENVICIYQDERQKSSHELSIKCLCITIKLGFGVLVSHVLIHNTLILICNMVATTWPIKNQDEG